MHKSESLVPIKPAASKYSTTESRHNRVKQIHSKSGRTAEIYLVIFLFLF